MYPTHKQKNALSYGDPKVVPLIPKMKIATIKTSRNGVPTKMRYNEDIREEYQKKSTTSLRKQPHELRTTFNKKW